MLHKHFLKALLEPYRPFLLLRVQLAIHKHARPKTPLDPLTEFPVFLKDLSVER
jgi:hypothetical protein